MKRLYNSELYMTLLSTSSYYIIQLSGQKAQEYLLLKTQLKEHGFRMIRPKTKLLSTLVPLELSKMCMGPISLIYKNKQEDPNPKLVFKACEKSGGKKHFQRPSLKVNKAGPSQGSISVADHS